MNIKKNMFNVILAITKNKGIGYKGKLPWKCTQELKLFKQKTMNTTLVMGLNTAKSVPYLENRKVIVLSKNKTLEEVQSRCKTPIHSVHRSLDDILQLKLLPSNVFVCGGKQIYEEVFTTFKKYISKVYLSVMEHDYLCDTFVDFDYHEWTIHHQQEHEGFNHYILHPHQTDEKLYLKLLKNVMENGSVKCGRNGETKSTFGNILRFDLRKGYPLITTKKMFFRGVVEELLFFIRGDTDSGLLEQKNVNIWKGNTSRIFLDSIGLNNRREGVLGPMYGYQWRYFNSPYNEKKTQPSIHNKGIDQLTNVINMIQHDPHSRRIMMTDYNPEQVTQGVLYPCHSIIIQFYVSSCEKYLDMFCYNRSSDMFHGLPFNIASSSLLHILISKITNKIARQFTLTLGDSHIYKDHYDTVSEQLQRIPYSFPNIEINKDLQSVSDLEKLTYKDIKLIDYQSHSPLKVKMVV